MKFSKLTSPIPGKFLNTTTVSCWGKRITRYGNTPNLRIQANALHLSEGSGSSQSQKPPATFFVPVFLLLPEEHRKPQVRGIISSLSYSQIKHFLLLPKARHTVHFVSPATQLQ